MNSIAIATQIDFNNYGNRLQNYALQEAFHSLGFDRVDTIVNQHGPHNGYPPLRRKVELALNQGPRVLEAVLLRMQRKTAVPVPQNACLRQFSQQHLSLLEPGYRDPANVGLDPDQYDFFALGSDQVWNPVFGLPHGLDFLQFARPSQRVCYSPSFGVDTIPVRLRRRYRRGLAGLPRVSVRETQGAAIVERLTSRRPPVVVDPTMLLGPDFWRAFAARTTAPARQPYVALARLSASDTPALSAALARAGSEGLEVVDLLADRCPAEEFVARIAGAERVLTDSFHVSLFALLFGTPLGLIGRAGMTSRLSTLLSLAGLDVAVPESATDLVAIAPDHDRVLEQFADARARSWSYLTAAFG